MKKAMSRLLTICLALLLFASVGVVVSENFVSPAKAATPPTWSPSVVPETDYLGNPVSIWDGTAMSESLAGSGTEEDPYLIQSAADFIYFCHVTTASDESYYKMTCDVSMTDPADPTRKYDALNETNNIGGTLDGDGHTIYNMGTPGEDWGSSSTKRNFLFGTISSGTVKNLNFDGVYIWVKRIVNYKGASIFTDIYGSSVISNLSIKNAHVITGSSEGNLSLALFANTVCGYSNPKDAPVDEDGNYIFDSVLFENVRTEDCVVVSPKEKVLGGFVYKIMPNLDTVTFRDCDIELDIFSSSKNGVNVGTYVGSAAAEWMNYNPVVKEVAFENCISRGNIYLTDVAGTVRAGGFIGNSNYMASGTTYPLKSVRFDSCVNYTDITLTGTNFSALGGFVGALNGNLNATDCVNYGTISGIATEAPTSRNSQCVGGFAGYMGWADNSNVDMTNCAQNGDVTSTGAAGGLVGVLHLRAAGSRVTLKGVSVNCDVKGDTYAGGLIGLGYRNIIRCASCNKELTWSACSDPETHKIGYYYPTYTSSPCHLIFSLESASVCGNITVGDAPGSVLVYSMDTAKKGIVSSDTNCYFKTNCTTYVHGSEASPYFNDPTKSSPSYAASDYTSLEPTNPDAYDDPHVGATARLMQYARENGYHFWVEQDGKPTIIYNLAITDPYKLSREYNGKEVAPAILRHASVAGHELQWMVYQEGTGTYVPIAQNLAPTDVGKYRLEIALTDPSGDPMPSEYVDFEITPYQLDLSTLVWEYPEAFTYDKSAHTVALDVEAWLLSNLTISYENHTSVQAGTFTAAATVSAATPNVVVLGTAPSQSWEVKKANLDVSEITIQDEVHNYNGTAWELTLIGEASDPDALCVTYSQTPTDAGVYTITVTLSIGDTVNYGSITGETTHTATLEIKKIKLVLEAEDATLTYTGAPLAFPLIVRDELGNQVENVQPQVTVKKDGVSIPVTQVVDVGRYEFHLSFGNSNNYEGASVDAVLEVTKATPVLTYDGIGTFVYDGHAHEVSAVASNGKPVTITYYLNGTEVGTPVNAGEYIVKVHCKGDANHNDADYEASLIITPKETLVLEGAVQQNYAYTGTPMRPRVSVTNDSTATLRYTIFQNGVQLSGAINCGSYVVVVKATSRDGNSVGTLEIRMDIVRAKTEIAVEDITLSYTGDVLDVGAALPHNEGTLEITYTKAGVEVLNPKDAGTYVAVVRFAGSQNYLPAEKTVTMTVLPMTVTAPNFSWEYNDDFVYDGTTHQVLLKNLNTDMFTVVYRGHEATNAGDYTATATIYCTANYVLAEDSESVFTLTWRVKRASISVESIVLKDDTVTYDGNPHNLVVTGTLPAGVTVTYSAPQTNAGVYTVTASFALDDPNNFDTGEIASLTATLTIVPAQYNMTGVKLPDTALAYDGSAHTILPQGTLPDGVTYTTEGEYVEVGSYLVIVHFTGDANHQPIPDMTATLFIMALSVTDTDSRVTMDIPQGMPHDATWTVTTPTIERDMHDVYDIMRGGTVEALYQFSLQGPETDVVLTSAVTIRIPVSDFKEGDTPCVVHFVTDSRGQVTGVVEVKDVTYQDGHFVFQTDDLTGMYGVVTKDTNVLLIVGIVVGSLAVVAGGFFGVKALAARAKVEHEDEDDD